MTNKVLHVDDPIAFINKNLNLSISVEASAGCGKTYALISRVCEILKSGRSTIDRLLLLTFTENAASEMKTRLSIELSKQKEAAWASSALDSLNKAPIQTIHSFALDICKSFHDQLGLPEDITISDDIDSVNDLNLFFDSKYNSWGNNDELLTLFVLCKHLNISRSTLRNAFEQTLSHSKYIPIDTDENDFDSKSSMSQLEDLLANIEREIIPSAQALTRSATCLDLKKLNKTQASRHLSFTSFCENLLKTNTAIELYKVIENSSQYIGSKNFHIKEAKTWDSNYLEFERTVSNLGDLLKKYSQQVLDEVLRHCSQLSLSITKEYRDKTFSSGSITFDESILAARRALEIEYIREQIWKRFDSIIVDEFQDTDINQLAILEMLSEDQSEDEIGRLFVVGDNKQSIYGFRGASVKGYEEFISTQPITRVALHTSRRTVPSVISLINSVSENLIPDYENLKGVRNDINDEHNADLIGESYELKINDIRQIQSQDIAVALKKMSNHSLIYDKISSQIRPCTYSDMTILIRDKTSLQSVTESLDAYSIPYSIDSSSLVWDLTMTRSILALLKSISDPSNAFATIAALKTSVFSLTNTDLASYSIFCSKNKELFKTSSIWDYRNLPTLSQYSNKQVEKTFNALRKINNLHEEKIVSTPVSLINRILFDEGIFQDFCVAFTQSQAKSVANFLISDASNFENSHVSSSIDDYVKHFESKRKLSQKSDSFIDTTEENRVRIMTIHASKGLEFPIVAFIPSQKNYSDKSVTVHSLEDGEIALSLNSKRYDSRLEEIKETQKDFHTEEEARLSYVAMTRAQDHLLISTHNKTSKTVKSQAGLIYKATQNTQRQLVDTEFSTDEKLLMPKPDSISDIESCYEHLRDTHNPNYFELSNKSDLFIKTLESQRSVVATSIKPEEFINTKKIHRRNDFLAENIAPAIGRCVHRVMNIISFDADQTTVKELCRRCGEAEGLVDKEDFEKCEAMVARALRLKFLNETNSEIYRELAISGYINGIFCEGYIDLLKKTSEGYVIVDYKTDTIDQNRSIEDKIKIHSYQLAFYSLLIKQQTNSSNVRAMLLFLDNKEEVVVEIENLEDIEMRVLDAISTINISQQ